MPGTSWLDAHSMLICSYYETLKPKYFLLLNGKVNLERAHTLIELFIMHVNYGELSRLKQHQRV